MGCDGIEERDPDDAEIITTVMGSRRTDVAPTTLPATPLGPWVMRGCLLLMGMGVSVGGLHYGITLENGHVGPGLMPFAAGMMMVVAGLWETGSAWRSYRRESQGDEVNDTHVDETDSFGRDGRERRWAVVKVFGILLGATVLAELIGLLLSLTVMMLVLLVWIERKRWWVGLAGGAAAFLFGYLIFGVLLDVPLATGLLGLI